MVAKGLAGAASLALALASVGAFAPGTPFVRSPLDPASHGIDRIVNADGSVVTSDKVSFASFRKRFLVQGRESDDPYVKLARGTF